MERSNGRAIRVKLSPEILDLANTISAGRHIPKRKLGVTCKTIDKKHTQQEIDVLGVSGEFAAAKVLGLKIKAYSLLGGDGGVDMTTPLGLTIDVKTCRLRGWHFALINTSLETFKSDIGVLVWAYRGSDEFAVVGWTTKVHFAMNCQTTNFGYGERLVLEHGKMLDINRLLTALKDGKI